jgi:AraC-like DNA-binding protein
MPSTYTQIIQYIEANLKNEINIADIAHLTGYSPNHIYKLFKTYSPYPIMDCIRRKRLIAATADMYTGRTLYDIALDYGYGTPAGFYKAFKSIFGLPPSKYKILLKEGIKMTIRNTRDTGELAAVQTLYRTLYPNIEPFDKNDIGLFFYAKDGDKIVAFTLGFTDGGKSITVHEGIMDEYKSTIILEALFSELEKNAKKLGYKNIVLGIQDGEEEFYAKMGYIGKTLIQSEKHTVADLKAFNESHKNYEVSGSGVYDGHINQLWLNVSLLDKNIKHHYENEIGDCWVQIIVNKPL